MPRVKKDSEEKKRNSSIKILIVLIFIIAIVDLAFILTARIQQKTPETTDSYVSEVIDGDTFKLSTGETVRLIGINAPEPNSNFYSESLNFLKFAILNKQVYLEKDEDETDDSGKLWRYAFVDFNGKRISLNVESVKDGYSLPMPISPNLKYQAEIDSARQECLASKLNLCANS